MVLNAIVALMVFGASLDLRMADLRRVAQRPKGVLAGLSAQALLTPGLTCLLTWVFRVIRPWRWERSSSRPAPAARSRTCSPGARAATSRSRWG